MLFVFLERHMDETFSYHWHTRYFQITPSEPLSSVSETSYHENIK